MNDKETNMTMTVFDLKKEQYKSVEPYSDIEINKNITEICEIINNNYSSYYMLLNAKNNDYTVFHIKNKNINLLKDIITESLKCRGEILDMYDGITPLSWEIWLKEDNEIYCYILFNYEDGVAIIE